MNNTNENLKKPTEESPNNYGWNRDIKPHEIKQITQALETEIKEIATTNTGHIINISSHKKKQ